ATVIVKDETSGKSASLTHPFEVLKKNFGIGRIGLFYDEQGKVWAPPVFVAGQSAWIHFITVGFDRNQKGSPDVEVRMRVLDESGKQTLPGVVTGDTRNQKVGPSLLAVPWFQKIELN